MSNLSLEDAKTRITIPTLWGILDLPGKAGRSCRCPWREDHKPSFSISDDGRLWNDFTTGMGGDAVDFLRLATGLSEKDTCRKFIDMAGGRQSEPLPVIRRATTTAQARELPILPAMRGGTPGEIATLAELRNLDVEAVRVADGAGLLRFGEWKGRAAWFITEPGGRIAQARRMDGQPWEGIGAKAQTLPGCWATWPIGAGVGEYQTILFCEGGPDMLAAIHFGYVNGSADFGVVAMLGAGQRIHADALLLFAGKRVRIYNHADQAGREAARRWAGQLATVGAVVDAIDCGGFQMSTGAISNDLNDLVLVDPSELKGLLPDA